MNPAIIKTCEVCEVLFAPDPRVGQRQRVCRKLACQKERKRRAQETWLQKNPDYFKGRYDNLKDWLCAHPGYLKTYRQRRPSCLVKDDIQDKLSPSQTNLLEIAIKLRDIQDEITSKINKEQRRLDDLRVMIYKTSEPFANQQLDTT